MKILMCPFVYAELLRTFTLKEMDKIKIVGKVEDWGINTTLEMLGKEVDMRVTNEHPDKSRVDISCTVEELRELVNAKFEGFPPKEPELPPSPIRSMVAECFKVVCNKQIAPEEMWVPRWVFDQIAKHSEELDGKSVAQGATWFKFLGLKIKLHDFPYVSMHDKKKEVARIEVDGKTLEIKEIPVK